jgi:hypothetical protein
MDAGRSWKRLARAWPDLAAAAACVLAASFAWSIVSDLRWPGMEDFARDMAAAQHVLDHGRLGDPFYAGEELWYPPMAPLVTAAGARATGLPVPEVSARIGVWLNLLGPIAFYALGAFLFGRIAALAGLLCFLFLSGGDRPWFVIATYSPWLVPFYFAQGFFFLGVLALLRAQGSSGIRWHVLAGACAGLTFLTHVTPAVVLACIAAGIVLPKLRRPRSVLPFAATAAVAAALAAAFLHPLWARYRFRVQNPAPNNYVAGLDGAALLLEEVSVTGVLAGAGLVAMIFSRRRGRVAALLVWPAVCALAALWHHVRPTVAPGSVEVAPVHHWYVQLSAFRSLAFGTGVAGLAAAVTRLASRLRPGGPTAVRAAGPLVAAATVVAILVPAVARYPEASDRGRFREKALIWQSHPGAAVSRWMRANTRPDAVVLAGPDVGTLWIGPAGRKTMIVDQVLSSPFVDWKARDADYRSLHAAVKSGDQDAFLALADKYGVTHVLTGLTPPFSWITPVYRHGTLVVSAVVWPWEESGASRIAIVAPEVGAALGASVAPRVAMRLPPSSDGVRVTFDVEVRGEWFAVTYEAARGSLGAGEDGALVFVPRLDEPAGGAIPGLTWNDLGPRVAKLVGETGQPALRGRVKVVSFRPGSDEPDGISLPRQVRLVP